MKRPYIRITTRAGPLARFRLIGAVVAALVEGGAASAQGLPRAEAATPTPTVTLRREWAACEHDGDCVVHPGLDCCTCVMGGGPEVAINRAAVAAVEAERAARCDPPVLCLAVVLCRHATASCREGACTLERPGVATPSPVPTPSPSPTPAPGTLPSDLTACDSDGDCVIYPGLDCCTCVMGGGPEVAINRRYVDLLDAIAAVRCDPRETCAAVFLCSATAALCHAGACVLTFDGAPPSPTPSARPTPDRTPVTPAAAAPTIGDAAGPTPTPSPTPSGADDVLRSATPANPVATATATISLADESGSAEAGSGGCAIGAQRNAMGLGFLIPGLLVGSWRRSRGAPACHRWSADQQRSFV